MLIFFLLVIVVQNGMELFSLIWNFLKEILFTPSITYHIKFCFIPFISFATYTQKEDILWSLCILVERIRTKIMYLFLDKINIPF